MTIVPALLLPYFAWPQRRAPRPFLSTAAMVVLIVAYVGLPEMMSNWNYLNTRLVPFIWAGLALRLPTTLPRPVAIVLAVCALSFSAAQGIDYVQARPRPRRVHRGNRTPYRSGATLLPLLFKHSKTSYFTASLSHAWGYYTVAKNTSAPLVFGVERSYPITYRDFPPRKLIPPAFDQFAERVRDSGRGVQGAQPGPGRRGLHRRLARAVGRLLAGGDAPLQPPADLGHAPRSATNDSRRLPPDLRRRRPGDLRPIISGI